MVVVNGYIRVVALPQADSFDEAGNPVVDVECLGKRIPCNWVRNSYSGNSEAGSEYASASYTILIDQQEFKPCQYRLYDISGNELGLFSAKQSSIVILQAVGNIQISQ